MLFVLSRILKLWIQSRLICAYTYSVWKIIFNSHVPQIVFDTCMHEFGLCMFRLLAKSKGRTRIVVLVARGVPHARVEFILLHWDSLAVL